jgi:hypothetical protein
VEPGGLIPTTKSIKNTNKAIIMEDENTINALS